MESILSFCKKENIGFNDQEANFYKIQKAKKDHSMWSQSLNKLWAKEDDPDGTKAIIKELSTPVEKNMPTLQTQLFSKNKLKEKFPLEMDKISFPEKEKLNLDLPSASMSRRSSMLRSF